MKIYGGCSLVTYFFKHIFGIKFDFVKESEIIVVIKS